MPGRTTPAVLTGNLTDPVSSQFSERGPLAALLADFQPRSGQVALAETIAECLAGGADLVAEAATGTGKTLAYLLPALATGGRVIISTGTLNLQDQLFQRDLPLALKAAGAEKQVALLKGRANYLCQHRMEKYLADPEAAAGETGEHLRTVQRWSRQTISGEIRELAELPERSSVWPLVTSTVDNCLGTECPRYDDCHVLAARRRAQQADVVVVNHHLLFADLALKHTGFGEVLPGADAVIVDEAHQVPEIATRFFSRSVSVWQLKELGRDTLAACADAPGMLAVVRDPVESLRARLNEAISAAAELSERGEWQQLGPVLSVLESLQPELENLAQVLSDNQSRSRDLANCADRAGSLAATLGDLLAGGGDGVRWFSCRQGRFTLNLTPLDIAGPFSELRAQLPATWIMTSATLAVDSGFGHFTSRLGLENPRTLVVDSPFDYRQQARLWLPEGLPEPGSREHTERLLESILPLLEASQGRAFLLFTAHRALRRAAEWLRAHGNFRLLVQEDAPRDMLLDEFREAPGSLLLGAASFWEGVDVRGPALSVVVIDKLPFAAPDDPVLAATIRAVRESGGNAFGEIQLPAAVLALKQGAGRLIRHSGDYGVLVLGDPRLSSRGYGQVFLNSLPPMPRVDSRAEAIEFLHQKMALRAT